MQPLGDCGQRAWVETGVRSQGLHDPVMSRLLPSQNDSNSYSFLTMLVATGDIITSELKLRRIQGRRRNQYRTDNIVCSLCETKACGGDHICAQLAHVLHLSQKGHKGGTASVTGARCSWEVERKRIGDRSLVVSRLGVLTETARRCM